MVAVRSRIPQAYAVFLILIFLYPLRTHGADVSADPFFDRETKDTGSTVRAVGPVFEFSPHLTAVRPFYAKDRDTGETDILYPLGRFTGERGLFFPLYRRTDEDDQHHVDFFPVFYGTYKDSSYWGIFPVYGTMEHRFGYDRTRFVLFPLFSETELDQISTYSFVWPIFSYSKDRTYKVFPLYGWERKADATSQFFLWPIVTSRRGPDSRKMDAVLPLYRYDRGPTYWNMSVLWPFFNYNRDYATNHTSADFPWPLIRRASGAYEETRIFPFYWVINEVNHSRKVVMWPLWSRGVWIYPDQGTDEESTMVLLTNWVTVKTKQDGSRSARYIFWPFFYSYQEKDRGEWHFPSLVPLFFDKGFSRTWGPVLSLAEGRTEGTASETSILWRTVHWERHDDTRSWSFSFLAGSTRTPEFREWWLLGKLLSFKTENRTETPAAQGK